MGCGVHGQAGQPVALPAEEEISRGPDCATTQHLILAEQIALGHSLRASPATL